MRKKTVSDAMNKTSSGSLQHEAHDEPFDFMCATPTVKSVPDESSRKLAAKTGRFLRESCGGS